MNARDQFVATVRELFETDEQTFNTTFSLGYYNSVRSNTYQGKKPARYSDVQMLWEVFRAAYKLGLASQAQQEPSKDMHEAITLLSAVFDAWENGTDCYDDFDGVSGSFIGKAFNLDDEIFKRCCDLLNRVNPPRNVSQAQQSSQWISVEDRLPEMETPVVALVGKNVYALARVDYDEGWLWAICGCDLSDIRDYEADDDYQPTYWMPVAIPPAPEGDKP